jgi:hypothetical protein
MREFFITLSVALLCCSALAAPPLPSIQVYNNTISVSGFDSGAMFATQFQFAYSSRINAWGIFAGGPYLCGQGNLAASAVCMTNPELLDIAFFATQADLLASGGKIDPTSYLQNHFVYLASAPFDLSVDHETTLLLESMYGMYNVGQFATLYNLTEASHAWVTSQYGNPCSYFGPNYVNDCDFDFAGSFLQNAFSFLNVPWNATAGSFNHSHLKEFDQVIFGANATDNSVGNSGFVYIPEYCYGNTCHLHVHFHGCEQGKDFIGGSSYVSQTGLNEWAETNNIVILYPQVAPNAIKFNPLGCWDWFGYNTKDPLNYLEYATKNGVQIQMVWQMITALLYGIGDSATHTSAAYDP